jgi:hypothetical protein
LKEKKTAVSTSQKLTEEEEIPTTLGCRGRGGVVEINGRRR